MKRPKINFTRNGIRKNNLPIALVMGLRKESKAIGKYSFVHSFNSLIIVCVLGLKKFWVVAIVQTVKTLTAAIATYCKYWFPKNS